MSSSTGGQGIFLYGQSLVITEGLYLEKKVTKTRGNHKKLWYGVYYIPKKSKILLMNTV